MLLQDIKNIKNGRIISGQRELTLDADYRGRTLYVYQLGSTFKGKLHADPTVFPVVSLSTKEEIDKWAKENGFAEVRFMNTLDSKTKDDSESQQYKEGYLVGVREKTRGLTQPPYFGTKEREDWIEGYLKGYADSHNSNDSKTKDGGMDWNWSEKMMTIKHIAKRNGKDISNETAEKILNKLREANDYSIYRIKYELQQIFKDSKSTKDQIAELECQKEEAKKKGYGTDAYDAKIKSLQKDKMDYQEYHSKLAELQTKLSIALQDDNKSLIKELKDKIRNLNDEYNTSDSSDILTQDPKTKDDYSSSTTESYQKAQEGLRILRSAKAAALARGDKDKAEEIDEDIKEMENHYKYSDSKTKDDSRSEQAYDEGYEMALQGKPFSANPYKDVSRSGYADLKESWEDGYRDGRSGKSSTDSDIIINVVESPNEVEPEEEAFDLIHYNGYNIKLVKETGEYDIYDVGGAMIGHTATLELAKLFVDNKGNATIVYE